jgi:AcrR family transcriptional regulator
VRTAPNDAPGVRAPPSPDGRLARGERAKSAVVDALLALIEEGDLMPPAPRIAARAGVSLRLVFHHFRDLEGLFAACSARQLERIVPEMRTVEGTGPFAHRLAAFVEERARLLERIGPSRRAALLREPFSPFLRERLALVRAWKRADAERVFAHELEAMPPADREGRAAALGAATSFSCWESLRVHQGLSLEAARAAMARLVEGVLAARRNHVARKGRK